MHIAVQYPANNNNFDMIARFDEDGQLVCSHRNVEDDWCYDCLTLLDVDHEPDPDVEWKERDLD